MENLFINIFVFPLVISKSFQHDGVANLEAQLQFNPLGLEESKMEYMTSSIKYLLYGPNLVRFIPDEFLSAQCLPNKGAQSRIHLHCN